MRTALVDSEGNVPLQALQNDPARRDVGGLDLAPFILS